MWPVSARFLAALRQSHTAVVRVHVVLGDGSERAVPVESGSVSVDGTRAVRRQLQLTTSASASGWLADEVMRRGVVLRAQRGIRYPDRTVEWCPLGVFEASSRDVDFGPDGALSITGSDLFRRVVRARFLAPQVGNGRAVSEALRFAREATGTSARNECGTAARAVLTRSSVWERDREEAVMRLAAAAGAQVFMTPDGVVVGRDVTDPDRQGSVWTVDARPDGILLGGSQTASTDRVYNTVVVAGSAVDGSAPFAPVVVMDTNPNSPTYVGPPEARQLVPYFVTSELIRSAVQARAVGLTTLLRVSAPAEQMTVRTIPNPALEAGDVVTVLRRQGSRRLAVESFDVPLGVEADMTITMRSSRSADPEGEG